MAEYVKEEVQITSGPGKFDWAMGIIDGKPLEIWCKIIERDPDPRKGHTIRPTRFSMRLLGVIDGNGSAGPEWRFWAVIGEHAEPLIGSLDLRKTPLHDRLQLVAGTYTTARPAYPQRAEPRGWMRPCTIGSGLEVIAPFMQHFEEEGRSATT